MAMALDTQRQAIARTREAPDTCCPPIALSPAQLCQLPASARTTQDRCPAQHPPARRRAIRNSLLSNPPINPLLGFMHPFAIAPSPSRSHTLTLTLRLWLRLCLAIEHRTPSDLRLRPTLPPARLPSQFAPPGPIRIAPRNRYQRPLRSALLRWQLRVPRRSKTKNTRQAPPPSEGGCILQLDSSTDPLRKSRTARRAPRALRLAASRAHPHIPTLRRSEFEAHDHCEQGSSARLYGSQAVRRPETGTKPDLAGLKAAQTPRQGPSFLLQPTSLYRFPRHAKTANLT
ncbi:hypothetical protein GY45DRAFT_182936 [Cubamyces sp. BRFM 1775]|nr:hypothetical protein GY45DRAFT_182936 [Cubamyces sp. BRFM 1775]